MSDDEVKAEVARRIQAHMKTAPRVTVARSRVRRWRFVPKWIASKLVWKVTQTPPEYTAAYEAGERIDTQTMQDQLREIRRKFLETPITSHYARLTKEEDEWRQRIFR